MKALPLNQLGPRETSPGIVEFGVLLPWISALNGNRLFVKIIHERDQFIQAIQPQALELHHDVHSDYGDKWTGQVDFNAIRDPQSASHFGSPGRRVYRFELHNPNRHTGLDRRSVCARVCGWQALRLYARLCALRMERSGEGVEKRLRCKT